VQVLVDDGGLVDGGSWHSVINTHDRRGSAEARARALVFGLPAEARPGWYGDRRAVLGTYPAARVMDAAGEVVHVEELEGES
jgi:hypothetical protein